VDGVVVHSRWQHMAREDARKRMGISKTRDMTIYKIRQAFLFFFLLGASMGAGVFEGLLAV
jgi:hypothetical protein